jgi:hypothetical protein
MIKRYLLLITIFFLFDTGIAQTPITVARIKYDGGGDWYGNRTTFVNIFKHLRELQIPTLDKEVTVTLTDKALFKYPIIYIAGHGNVKFSDAEVQRMRKYLTAGGFLWADDDFGMDVHFRREMKKVFPELEWVELPFSHPIFHRYYNFPNGLPKIHKHAGGPPKALALFYRGRMVAFYSFNTDISDGCEDPDIHKDPAEVRQAALQMATNILLFALTQ